MRRVWGMGCRITVLACCTMVAVNTAHAAAEWSAQTHRLYVGDFNADGRDDLLVVARAADRRSGVVLSEANTGLPSQIRESWPSDHLGLQWHDHNGGNPIYRPKIGSFNEPLLVIDGSCALTYYFDDIFMQRYGAFGSHHVLYANNSADPTDSIFGTLERSFTDPNLGLTWGTNAHEIHVAQLTRGAQGGTNNLDDFVLQPTSREQPVYFVVGQSATAYEDPNQVMNAVPDGTLGFGWSTQDSALLLGNLSGTSDGRAEILLQAKVSSNSQSVQFGIVTLDSPVSTAVDIDDVFAEWQRYAARPDPNDPHFDWSANTYNLVVGDFNGDGLDDIFMQPRLPGDYAAYFVFINGQSDPNAWRVLRLSAGAGIDWANGVANLLVGDFNGDGKSQLYYQTKQETGVNRIITLNSNANALPHGADLAAVNLTVVTPPEPTLDPATPPLSVNPGSAVGATPGEFSVSQNGAATYTIPLTLVPGVAGMQPQLSLSYNSQGGNGLLGMGWTLDGLSAITRCPATQAQDGFTDGVDLDANDRYCIDGMRLIEVGTLNGQPEFRTEIDTFQRVVATGTASGITGPAGFKVDTKSRNTLLYGRLDNQNDALAIPTGSSHPLVWGVKQIRDSYGNVINFTYDSPASGQFRPIKITYGNGAVVAGSVLFTYESRLDNSQAYISGYLTETAGRLKSIKTFRGNEQEPVREYVLDYDYSAASSRSLLKSLTECERKSNTCFRSSVFDWQEKRASRSTSINLTQGFEQILDVNNDGRNDYLRRQSDEWQLAMGHPNGSAPSGYSPIPVLHASSRAVVGDFNNDGYMDVLEEWLSTRRLLTGGPAGLAVGWEQNVATSPAFRLVGDIDGDGFPDQIRVFREMTNFSETCDGGWCIQVWEDGNTFVHVSQGSANGFAPWPAVPAYGTANWWHSQLVAQWRWQALARTHADTV